VTRYAVNVGFLYRDLLWRERFAAARNDGFEAVESAWPADPDAFAEAVARERLRVALLNVAAGDLDAGDRGWTNDPSKIASWRRAMEDALRLAARVGCPTLNVLAGNRLADVEPAEQRACLRENLRWALPRAAAGGVTLVVELLNPIDTPDYLVTDLRVAERLIGELRDDGLRLQFDTYHAGRVGLDVVAAFRSVASSVGHVQVADVPGRHEPGTGSVDWVGFFAALDAAGYRGAVGLEYHPLAGTSDGLAWLPREARRWSDQPVTPSST
jgi:hydroxypyruvate isomerase